MAGHGVKITKRLVLECVVVWEGGKVGFARERAGESVWRAGREGIVYCRSPLAVEK